MRLSNPSNPIPTFDECERCHQHVCLPCRCRAYQCAEPMNGEVDDWRTAHARDAEDAAKDYCRLADGDGDYSIVRSGSTEVWVKDPDGTVTQWDIEAESEPVYTARPKRIVPPTAIRS